MSKTGFRNDIQGLRAIAVLAVMVFHYNPAWLPGGFVGVDVFLVISGFLITSILINKKTKPDYTLTATLKYFYVSRFRRIAPAYFVMLVAVAFVAAALFIPKDFANFKDGLEKATWFASNHYFADFGDYFAPANHEQPLLHTWSLAVEMQFYLIAPFLVLLLRKTALKSVFLILLIGMTLFVEYRLRAHGIEQATYYSFYARLPEFFAGGLAAIYSTSGSSRNYQWLPYVGIALIVLAAAVQPSLGPFPGISVLLPVLGTAMILHIPAHGVVGRILRNRGLVWIGALSYSLYLWHWPVLAFLRYYSGEDVLNLNLGVLFILLTIALSVASYYAVEQAFHRSQSRKKQVLGGCAITLALLITAPVSATVSEKFTPPELPSEYRRYADPSNICHGKLVGECLKGDLGSAREILVLGDSHAAMLNHFFDHLGKALHFKARIITASGCVTIPEFDYERIPGWAQKPCLEQIKHADNYLQGAGIIFLAAKWHWQLRSDEFRHTLESFLDSAHHRNTKVFIIGQVPVLTRNPHRLRRFNNLGLISEHKIKIDYEWVDETLSEISKTKNATTYLKINDVPIFANPPFYNKKLMYLDSHHINEVGALQYAKQARPMFKDILGP